MSGYLFNLNQSSDNAYIARGNLRAFGINNWNLATTMGVYEILAADYPSYVNAGPIVGNGLLQVHRSGLGVTQIMAYSAGQMYSRCTGNSIVGQWSPWTPLSGSGTPTPVGGPAPVGTPVGAPAPVGTPVGTPTPVGGPAPVGTPTPVGSPVGSPVGAPVG